MLIQCRFTMEVPTGEVIDDQTRPERPCYIAIPIFYIREEVGGKFLLFLPSLVYRGLESLRSQITLIRMVEPIGIEPTTSTMPLWRSSN
jgi:hypothetical protein